MNTIKVFRFQLWQYFKFSLFTFPVIAGLYIPYNLFWIHYTGEQAIRWILTAAPMSALANIPIKLWISFLFKRGWLK